MTPKAYAAAHRAERVRDGLDAGARPSPRRSTAPASTPAAASTTQSDRTARHDARRDYRAGGARHDDPLRGRRVLAGLDPGRRAATRASAPSCSATTRTRWCATCRTASRKRAADRRRRRLRAAGRPGGRLRRGARRSASTCRSTCAAPRSSSGSGRRCARSRPGATASYAEIARAHRRAQGGARGGPGLRAPTRSRWPSPATAWCATTARCPATAGASSASARCSTREAAA